MARNTKKYIIFGMATLVLATLIGLVLLWVKTHRNTCEKGRELLQKGQDELDKDNNIAALINLQDALNIAEACDDEESYFEAAVYIAVIYNMTGQQQKAYDLLKSLKYVQTKSKKYYASQYYFRLMAYFTAKYDKNYEQSAKFAEMVIKLDKQLHPNDNSIVYSDMSNLGELLLMGENYEKAWAIVNQLRNSKPAENRLYLAQLHYVHSSLLFLQKEYDEAYRIANEGIRYSNLYKSPELELLNREVLCKIDSARGDYKSYMTNKYTLEKLADNVHGNEINGKIAAIEMQNKVEWARAEAKRTKLLYHIGVGLFCLLLVITFVAINYYNKYKKTKQKLSWAERQRSKNELQCACLRKELHKLKKEFSAEE